MAQGSFSHSITNTLVSLAFLGLSAVVPTLWQQWKEAKRKLDFWREYEIRVEEPNEKMKQWLSEGNIGQVVDFLEEEGFEYLGDYMLVAGSQMVSATPPAPLPSPMAIEKNFTPIRTDVSRVLQHRNHGCLAFLTASVHHLEATSTAIVHIASADEKGDWYYTSSTGESTGIDAGHSPHRIQHYHGSVSAQELLEAHLHRRVEIAREGGFTWGEPLTMNEIFQKEEKDAAFVRNFAGRHSPLSLLQWEHRINANQRASSKDN